jgi:hypothetical protein
MQFDLLSTRRSQRHCQIIFLKAGTCLSGGSWELDAHYGMRSYAIYHLEPLHSPRSETWQYHHHTGYPIKTAYRTVCSASNNGRSGNIGEMTHSGTIPCLRKNETTSTPSRSGPDVSSSRYLMPMSQVSDALRSWLRAKYGLRLESSRHSLWGAAPALSSIHIWTSF